MKFLVPCQKKGSSKHACWFMKCLQTHLQPLQRVKYLQSATKSSRLLGLHPNWDSPALYHQWTQRHFIRPQDSVLHWRGIWSSVEMAKYKAISLPWAKRNANANYLPVTRNKLRKKTLFWKYIKYFTLKCRDMSRHMSMKSVLEVLY